MGMDIYIHPLFVAVCLSVIDTTHGRGERTREAVGQRPRKLPTAVQKTLARECGTAIYIEVYIYIRSTIINTMKQVIVSATTLTTPIKNSLLNYMRTYRRTICTSEHSRLEPTRLLPEAGPASPLSTASRNRNDQAPPPPVRMLIRGAEVSEVSLTRNGLSLTNATVGRKPAPRPLMFPAPTPCVQSAEASTVLYIYNP